MNPIGLSPGCVRAILAGRKTLVRSTVEPGPDGAFPLGGPGDLLWVREPWTTDAAGSVIYEADRHPAVEWQPARTLPQEHSRLALEIRSIRRERLQEIPDADLAAEGRLWAEDGERPGELEREGFARWWDALHPRPELQWASNPAVWVLEVAAIAGDGSPTDHASPQ